MGLGSGNVPVNAVITVVNRASQQINQIAGSVQRLDSTFGTLGARIRTGLQWHLVYNGIRMIERGIYGLVNAIPNLISRGQQWAAVVDDISDATGMTAEHSSELAAVQLMLGGSTESLSKALVQLTRNSRMHEDVLVEMGVATRDQHGNFLSIYQILQQLRNAYAATGDRATAFVRAYQQLGRGTREVTDLLQLNAGQYAALAAQAQRAGLIMDETMARNAEALKRTQSILDATITGLGNQVLGGVAPVLTALTNGISDVIQKNMSNILQFVVRVVGIIAGFVSGLFGIDLNLMTIAGQLDTIGRSGERGGDGLTRFGQGAQDAASGASAAERAIQRQIDAIDRQLRMLDRQQDREDAREEHRGLMQDISEAKAELADLRTQSIFAAGMSDAEAELARQALAANIIEQEKRVAEARDRLHEWERDRQRDLRRQQLQDQRDALQEQLSAMRGAGAAMIASAGSIGIRIGDNIVDPLSKKMKQAMAQQRQELMGLGQEALETGREIARGLRAALFGEDVTTVGGDATSPWLMGRPTTTHTDGLIRVFQNLGDGLGKLGGFLSDNSKHLSNLIGLMPTLIAALGAWKLGGMVGLWPFGGGGTGSSSGNRAGGRAGGSGGRGIGAGLGVAGGIIAALFGQDAANAGTAAGSWAVDQAELFGLKKFFDRMGSGRTSSAIDYSALMALYLHPPTVTRPTEPNIYGPFWSVGGAPGVGNPTTTDQLGHYNPDYMSGIANWFWRMTGGTQNPDNPWVNLLGLTGAGLGLTGTGQFNLEGLGTLGRDYLDSGSPVVTRLDEMKSSISSLAEALTADGDGGGTNTSLGTRVYSLEKRMRKAEEKVDALAPVVTRTFLRVNSLDRRVGKAEDKVDGLAPVVVKTFLRVNGLDDRMDRAYTRLGSHGRMLDTHEARLDRLDGGGGGPHRQGGGGPSRVTIQLDAHATRRFLRGDPVTTTTRAGLGV